MAELTAIHISHMHADHFCERTLQSFPKHIPVIIAKHKDGHFAAAVRKLGFEKVVEIEPGPVGAMFGDIRLNLFLPNRNHPYDSSLVATYDGKSYLFDNDTRFAQEHYFILSQYFPSFEAAFVGYADSYPFPLIFDFSQCENFYSDEVDQRMLGFVEEQSWKRVEGICELLKPRWVFPYAASFRIRHRDLLQFNQMFFPVRGVLNRNLHGARPVCLHHGDVVAPGELPSSDPARFIEPEILPLGDIDEGDVSVEFIREKGDELRSRLREVLIKESRGWVSEMSIRFEVVRRKEEPFCLGFIFDREQIADAEVSATDADITIQYAPAVMRKFLSREWNFHNVNYSYRVRAIVRRAVPGQISVHRRGGTHF